MDAGRKQLCLYQSGVLLIAASCFSATFSSLVVFPRAMLSAHLVGLTGGLLLIAIGVVLPHIKVGKFEPFMLTGLHLGNWLNLISSIYAAVTGAVSFYRPLTKDLAPTFSVDPIHHQICTFMDMTIGVSIAVGLGLAALGICLPCCDKKKKSSEKNDVASRSSSSTPSERKPRSMEKLPKIGRAMASISRSRSRARRS